MIKRRKQIIMNIAVILFFAAIFSFFPLQLDAESSIKKVLVLNSYNEGLSWTDDEMTGILDVLKNTEQDLSILVEYMDWKNYDTEENLILLKERFIYKYLDKKIDIIITTDDAALDFAMKNRKEIFSDAPVVFCGVNDKGVNEILRGKTMVTGVVEKIEPAKTFSAALEINPNINQVFLIFDKTESGISTGEMSVNAIKRIDPYIKIVELNDSRLEYIFNAVRTAPKDSIVISTTYLTTINGTLVGLEYFSRMLSLNSSVPVYNLYEYGIGNGAIGGCMLSGKLQGEEAAKMALRVLQGEDISKIAINRSDTNRFVFDYKELQRFNADVNSVPKGSEIVNKPPSYYEIHKNVIRIGIVIIIPLILFIIALLFYMKKTNKMKEEIYNSHVELTGLYEDLMVADNKLKLQFSELMSVQKNLNSSENRFELLFNKMINGFFVIEPLFDAENKLTEIIFANANPGFYNQTSLQINDIIGKTWSEVFGFSCHELSIYHSILLTGEAKRFETYYKGIDTYYILNAFLISENKIGVVLENITGYKAAIKEVKQLNTELELRVSKRTAELKNALNELEAFSYTVSHDLKTPLRAVNGYTEILIEDLAATIEDDTIVMLQNIKAISKNAIDMVNKLLQYSMTSRAVLVREPVDMNKMVNEVFNELHLVDPERNISLIIETTLPCINADRVLFRQLIQNIISNAFKFTKGIEKAIIIVGCALTEKEYIFYIEDNGVGFDMNYSDKLFKIFQRLHTNDEFEGNGIGLITVKKIIEKHGGRVWIEGQVDTGAVIHFTVPIKDVARIDVTNTDEPDNK